MPQCFLDLDMVETVHYSLSHVQNLIMYSTSVALSPLLLHSTVSIRAALASALFPSTIHGSGNYV